MHAILMLFLVPIVMGFLTWLATESGVWLAGGRRHSMSASERRLLGIFRRFSFWVGVTMFVMMAFAMWLTPTQRLLGNLLVIAPGFVMMMRRSRRKYPDIFSKLPITIYTFPVLVVFGSIIALISTH